MAPICKNPCRLAVPPHQVGAFAKTKNIFGLFLGPTGVLSAVCALLVMFCSWQLFDGFGRTRKAKCSVGCRETTYFEILSELWHIWPYSPEEGHIGQMQSGASSGSPVCNTDDRILFLWSIVVVFCLCVRHLRTPKSTVFF